MLSFGCIIMNSAIIYFTSTAMETYIGDRISKVEQLLIIVLIEHIIIGLKVFLAALIKDIPDWISKEDQQHEARL